jgi:hypothetical protein
MHDLWMTLFGEIGLQEVLAVASVVLLLIVIVRFRNWSPDGEVVVGCLSSRLFAVHALTYCSATSTSTSPVPASSPVMAFPSTAPCAFP